jgi:SAM-dependent methyltransferase
MIGRSELPPEYRAWNKHWGAPFGYHVDQGLEYKHRLADENPARYGPFGFYQTSLTRVYEYPWAFHIAEVEPGMRVIDVGGWLSGFQIALAKSGCHVTNVDPSDPQDTRWTTSHREDQATSARDQHSRYTSLFGADVTLLESTLQDAELDAGTFDRIFAISVLEHVSQQEAGSVLKAMRRLLAPGGRAVLSIDLFFDLPPFGPFERNFWGTNLDVCQLVKESGLAMVHGDPHELHGFPEFDPDSIVKNIGSYNLSLLYPVVSQLLVLEKTS